MSQRELIPQLALSQVQFMSSYKDVEGRAKLQLQLGQLE